MNVKFHKNCEKTGKILKISCVRCNFVKFDIHFLGLFLMVLLQNINSIKYCQYLILFIYTVTLSDTVNNYINFIRTNDASSKHIIKCQVLVLIIMSVTKKPPEKICSIT